MDIETPKSLDNVTTLINGSVRELCRAVESECIKYGYERSEERSCRERV